MDPEGGVDKTEIQDDGFISGDETADQAGEDSIQDNSVVPGEVAALRPPPKKFTGPTHGDPTGKADIQDDSFMPGDAGKTEVLCNDVVPGGGEYVSDVGSRVPPKKSIGREESDTEIQCNGIVASGEYAEGAAGQVASMRPPPKKFTGPTHGDPTGKTEIQDSGFMPGKTEIQDSGFMPGKTEVLCNDVVPGGGEYAGTSAPVRGGGSRRRLATVLGVVVIAIVGVIAVLNMATGDDAPVTPQGDVVVPPSEEEDKAPQQNEQQPNSGTGDQGPANQPDGDQQKGPADTPGDSSKLPEKPVEEKPVEEKPAEEKPPEPVVEKPTEKEVAP